MFRELDQQGVAWCLLREAAPRDGEMDLLVDRSRLKDVRSLLRGAGFVTLPSLGRGSHRFFLRYERELGRWLTLDFVTELAFGHHFQFRADAQNECLARRSRRRDGTWELDRQDAFWALLFHCLLDKQEIAARHARRLQQLATSATGPGPLASHFVRVAPAGWTPERVSALAEGSDWNALRALGPVLARSWLTHDRRSVPRFAARSALRVVERPFAMVYHRGMTVAVLGMDGAGKSTLIRGLEASCPLPTRSVYMGLWKENGLLDRTPALRPLRIVVRPFAAWRRYAVGRINRALGRLVLFDRYTYDPYEPPTPPFVTLKSAYMRLLAHTCPAPDLILLLNLPPEIAAGRKADEEPGDLERKHGLYAAAVDRLPGARVIDATRPPEEVLAESCGHIWELHHARGSRGDLDGLA